MFKYIVQYRLTKILQVIAVGALLGSMAPAYGAPAAGAGGLVLPTLAPMLEKTTPAVVNILYHGQGRGA